MVWRFRYLTLRQRLTPRDLTGTPLDRPKTLHFICSPTRAQSIVAEIHQVEGWEPITIYEPIPVGVTSALQRLFLKAHDNEGQMCSGRTWCTTTSPPTHRHIEVCSRALSLRIPNYWPPFFQSPNSDEALSILSMPSPPNKQYIEEAAACFLDMGLGQDGKGHIVIRSGELGAYVASRERRGQWVNAFWTPTDVNKIVDVTGACIRFLFINRSTHLTISMSCRCRKQFPGRSVCGIVLDQWRRFRWWVRAAADISSYLVRFLMSTQRYTMPRSPRHLWFSNLASPDWRSLARGRRSGRETIRTNDLPSYARGLHEWRALDYLCCFMRWLNLYKGVAIHII